MIKPHIKYTACILIVLLIAVFVFYPVSDRAYAVSSASKITFKLSKVKLMPMESFSVTVDNVPSNEATMLALVSSQGNLDYSCLVYYFLGNERSVINLCAPNESGNYKLLLLTDVKNEHDMPKILAQSQEFEVKKFETPKDETLYMQIDPHDLVNSEGFTDFGPMNLFRYGKTVKGYATWNNMQISGVIKRVIKDQDICLSLKWVTYTSKGKIDKTGDMVMYISRDGEQIYGRYRVGKNGYWITIGGSWMWGPLICMPINKENILKYYKDNKGITLMWSNNALNGLPVGYYVYKVNSKGVVVGKPLNNKPIIDTTYRLNIPDTNQNYAIKAVTKSGKQLFTAKTDNMKELSDYLVTVNGYDSFSSAKEKNKKLTVDPKTFIESISNTYADLFLEKYPDEFHEAYDIFKSNESSEGNSVTISYKDRSLKIDDNSAYYWANGVKKSWGSTFKKIEDQSGYSYFEIPLSVLTETLGLKAETDPKGNIINIMIEL